MCSFPFNQRHSVPRSAIPCLEYRRQLDQEINVVNGFPDKDDKTEEMGQNIGDVVLGGKRKCDEGETEVVPKKQSKNELNGVVCPFRATSTALQSINVVASGTSGVSLEVPVQSPDRHSLNPSQEEATISPEPSCCSVSSQEQEIMETLPNSVNSSADSVSSAQGSEIQSKILPIAKVATAKENHSMHSISPEELREYCKSVFKFKVVKCKRFK